MLSRKLLPVLCLLSLASPAFAEDSLPMDHAKMNHEMADPFAQSRADMHKGMDVKSTGDVDKDFVANMIPHHEGAVAMAKVVLAHGTDPELRKLAEDIIKAQATEIAFMKDWQKKHAPETK